MSNVTAEFVSNLQSYEKRLQDPQISQEEKEILEDYIEMIQKNK
jgi:hypothetical protein